MWYDVFKLFWYAFMKETHDAIPDDAIPDTRDMNVGFTSNVCQHPNAYYYGDTCPVTYKCSDCGATFIKVNE